MSANFLNFKPSIKPEIKAKIYEVCCAVEPFISGWLNWPEKVNDWELEPIEGNHVSGWIPKQDGGFYLSCYINNGWSSGRYACEDQKNYVESLYDDALSIFCAENGIHPDDEIPSDIEEYFWEFEHGYMSDPFLSFFRIFIENGDKGKYVTMQYGINPDAYYFQEKYHMIVKTLIMSENEFTQTSISNIIKELENK